MPFIFSFLKEKKGMTYNAAEQFLRLEVVA